MFFNHNKAMASLVLTTCAEPKITYAAQGLAGSTYRVEAKTLWVCVALLERGVQIRTCIQRGGRRVAIDRAAVCVHGLERVGYVALLAFARRWACGVETVGELARRAGGMSGRG